MHSITPAHQDSAYSVTHYSLYTFGLFGRKMLLLSKENIENGDILTINVSTKNIGPDFLKC